RDPHARGVRDLPRVGRTTRPDRADVQRRTAADAGDRSRTDGLATTAHARRTVHGTLPEADLGHVGSRATDSRQRGVGAVGRAERPAGPRDRRPRLRAGERFDGAGGNGPGTVRGQSCPKGVSGAVTVERRVERRPGVEHARAVTERLGHWVSTLDIHTVDDVVLQRLGLVLLDVVGVTALGAALDEHRALRAVWELPSGPAPLIGAGRTTTVDAAAWLNATALVALELDEGNKYAKGHPAAHGFPAVLALAAQRDSSGADTAAALLAAYEVAARFGR